jgi:hypothetical protein
LLAANAGRIAELQKTARRLGIFTEDRALLTCPTCGLMEDVLFDGRLVNVYALRRDLLASIDKASAASPSLPAAGVPPAPAGHDGAPPCKAIPGRGFMRRGFMTYNSSTSI